MISYFPKYYLLVLAVFIYGCQNYVRQEEKLSTKRKNDSTSSIERQEQVTEIEHYSKDLKKFFFDKYPAQECFVKGFAKTPDISKLKEWPEDILSRIKNDYQENNPNFNCKFKVISWGCGSPCQMVTIFDSETGKIIQTLTTSFGVNYKLQSRILISDPPLETPIDTNYRKTLGEPVYWELIGGQFDLSLLGWGIKIEAIEYLFPWLRQPLYVMPNFRKT